MEAFYEAFGNLRVNLVTDLNKDWLVLNSSICGCQPRKFLSRSALVQNFPSGFALVKLVGVKDLAVLDRRSCGGESVAVASLFGVVCVVTRRNVKLSEVICYRWLIDIINDLKIDLGSKRKQQLNSPTILPSEKATILSVHFYSWPGTSKLFELEGLQKENITEVENWS